MVITRMPVTRGDHVLGVPGQPVDRLDYRVPVRHGERATEAEVILYVDDDQCLH